MDSAATAAYEAFASHPNTGNTLRLATAALQIGGGIVAILAPTGGVTQVIGVYSLAVGTDEALAAITGLITGEHVRSSREQGVDYFTEDQQLTDKLIFITDLGVDGFDAYQASRAWMKNARLNGARGGIDGIANSTEEFAYRMARRNDHDVDGYIDITGHANERVFNFRGQIVSADELAEILKQSPEYAGEPIRLLSCLSGVGGNNSFAQKLADALGVNVRAAPGYPTVYENGFHHVLGVMRNSDGSIIPGLPDVFKVLDYVTFTPRG